MRYLDGIAVLDVEATELDPVKGAILSVGMVAHNGQLNTFYREYYPFDGAVISEESMRIHGINPNRQERKPENDPKNVVADIRSFMQANGCIMIAGQNPGFDRSYVNAYAERYGIDFRLPFGMLDLHSFCLGRMLGNGIEPPKSGGHSTLSLDKVLYFVGLEQRQGQHNALDDAKLEFEAFCRLIYGKSVLPEFSSRPVPTELTK